MEKKSSNNLTLEQRKRMQRLSRQQKENQQRNKFLRTRMWFSIIVAKLFQDRGVIPRNIGNNIYIGNNQYITKYSISSLICVTEFSEETPIAMISKLIRTLKKKCPSTRVNVSIIQDKYQPKIHDYGMEAKVENWERILDSTDLGENTQKRAARLLYTYDIAKSGEPLYRSHVYITLRAETGTELKALEKEACIYLNDIGAEYRLIKSDTVTHLKYVSLMCNKKEPKIKDLPCNIFSAQTLAEVLPTTQGLNDMKGSFLGINRLNQNPYFIDIRSSSSAKNFYVVAESGSGKTFLVQTWLLDDYTQDYNLCIIDIKGTEFKSITEACGGLTISMTNKSTEYINTFRLEAKNVKDDSTLYFNQQFKMSKLMLLYLADVPSELTTTAEAFIEEFLYAVYLQLGVVAGNVKSWTRTKNLTPYVIYDYFLNYLSNDIKTKYKDIIPKMVSRYGMYLNRNGSESHMFRKEYNIADILENRVIRFDFGILDSSRVMDSAVFKVKTLFMQAINNEFSNDKKAKGEWVAKVLEEYQVAGDALLQVYKEEITLRRSQNQKTYLLGNSVQALFDNPIARPIIENMNVLCIGSVHDSSRKALIQEYNLGKYEDDMKALEEDPSMENTFLLINKMQRDSAMALLRAYVPKEVSKGALFHNVDTE